MENITDEQFQRLLNDIEQSSGPGLFDTFFDPTLLPGNGEDGSFLCFPPLPPIEEEEVPPISDVPPLEEDGYASSIASSAPENDQALTMLWVERLLEQQRVQQEKLNLETLETIRKYHIESLNPWIEHVTETLKNLGCMLEEPPASATDGEFDIKVFDRS
ncbi:hypothetical protein PENSUB_5134 [Penicillium subrubescens]|uniref:Uncharacterized protein n=1 Tax=Penicillium subrubescens TaxID=1316194 RepID=A0A1Q5UAL3_9EURO|nr:hypothetical protein PENSUB_5134 [Penicillium subrubescens]